MTTSISSAAASIFASASASASASKSSFVDEAALSAALGFDVRADLDSLVTQGFIHYGVVNPETMLFTGKGWEIQNAKKAIKERLSEVLGEVFDSETKEGALLYPGKEGVKLTQQQAACLQGIAWGSSNRGVRSAIYSNFFMSEATRLHKEYLAAKQDGYTATPPRKGTHAKGKGVTTSLADKLAEKMVKAQA